VKQVLTQRDVDEHIARQALGYQRVWPSASEIRSEAGPSAGRSGSIRPKACPTLIGAIVKAQVFVTDLANAMPKEMAGLSGAPRIGVWITARS
jgi:hypothetical protein